jgi:uncharacterized protein
VIHGPVRLLTVAAAAMLAGAVNSVAGGGTLLTFPTLLAFGVNPVIANATNTVALFPGSLAGAVGFRRELAHTRRWLALLLIPSVAGGILGAILLLRTPSNDFRTAAPFLVLLAAGLLAAQNIWGSRVGALGMRTSARWRAGAIAFQFAVALYGGFFGAGIGILMLASLGILGVGDIHEMNGLKNVLAICINGVAAVYFAASGAVEWIPAVTMAAGAIVGGFAGAVTARKLPPDVVRWGVVGTGVAVAIVLVVTN